MEPAKYFGWLYNVSSLKWFPIKNACISTTDLEIRLVETQNFLLFLYKRILLLSRCNYLFYSDLILHVLSPVSFPEYGLRISVTGLLFSCIMLTYIALQIDRNAGYLSIPVVLYSIDR